MSGSPAQLGRLICGALFAAALARPAAASDLYRWDFDAGATRAVCENLQPGKWLFVRNIDALEQRDGHLAFRVVAGDPYFYIDGLDVDAARWPYIVVVMKTSAGAFGQIFVAENEADSITFPLVADGRFHTYTIPVYRVASWRGAVRVLRIDPIDSGPARVEIDSLAISDEPAGAYEVSPAPPARVVLSEGATADVTVGILNTSGEVLKAIDVDLRTVRAGRGGSSQRRAALRAGERADFRWSIGRHGGLEGDARVRVRVAGETRGFDMRIDPRRPLVTIDAPAAGSHLYVAAAEVSALGDGTLHPGEAIPGEVEALVLSAEPGSAATLQVVIARDSGERLVAAARLPAAHAAGRYQLPLPGAGSGWRLVSAGLSPGPASRNDQRRVRELSFVVEAPPSLDAALAVNLPSFPTASGEAAYVARQGEPLRASLRLHNFSDHAATASPLFRLLADGAVVGESRASLRIAPEAMVATTANELRPPQSGPFTLHVVEPTSALDVRLPLAVVATDHTWEAVERMRAHVPSTAVLAADNRRDDDAPVAGFESPGAAAIDVSVSEISPAVRLSTRAARMILFGRLDDFGLGGPAHMAYAAAGGIRGAAIDPGRSLPTDMSENWSLFWFHGSRGWDSLTYSSYVQKYVRRPQPMSLDVPFLVVWQHRPKTLLDDGRGLAADFAGEAGVITIMPLFGALRIAGDETRAWAEEVPADVVAAARFWSRALLAYPIHVREDFSIDRDRGIVRVHETYRFHTIEDDWQTAPLLAAPISPSVSLAADAGFPVQLAGHARDTGFVTPFGPFRVVPDSDSNTYEIAGALRYLDEVPVPRTSASPEAKELRRRFARLQAEKQLFVTDVGWLGGASASLAQGFKASAVPYATAAEAERIRAVAQDQMSFFVLDDAGTYVTSLPDDRRGVRVLVDTFNHVMRWPGDDAAGSGEILRGLWEYAYQSGDWDFVRRRWERVRQAMRFLSGEQTWTMQSRPNSGGDTFHDVILGIAAYARMSAVLGEAADQRYASYLFAKNLLAYFNYEQASLDFARAHQPWIVPLVEEPMTNWDNYTVFGPFFTPLSQLGPYGQYSGFYEHYLRIGEGKYGLPEVLARVHGELLPEHSRWMFGEVMAKRVPAVCHHPDPTANRYCHQTPIDELRAYLGARMVRNPAATRLEAREERAGMLRTRLDALTIFEMRDLVPSSIAAMPPNLLQRGVDLDAGGIGFGLMMADVGEGRFAGLPVISWFGLNAPGRGGESHVDNLLGFGIFAPDVRRGAYIGRSARANWTTRTLHFEEVVGPLPESESW